ncbi:hypothetical protein BDV97DRAFT_355035 [Delphinella strobiligena]|nr:hypothetical protein BDV97DRAFT_355035 [Delphinella strobiligena]
MEQQFAPICIASTGKTFCKSIASCHPEREYDNGSTHRYRVDDESNCFRSAQLSADGSTVVTYSEDLVYRSFISPPNLLEESEEPHELHAYSITDRCPSNANTLYPFFDLSSPSTTLALIARTHLPIRLTNILDFTHTTCTYPWVNPTTEAFISPTSLAFNASGTHFIAGTDHAIAVFDLERNGEGPVEWHKTRKSYEARKRYGVDRTSLTGLVSALAIEPGAGVLAAATFDRQIALFGEEGSGAHIASFSLESDDERDLGIWGNGITQMKWSEDGRYLFVGERQSDALFIYDIRVTGKRLAWLKGRKAHTTQRLTFDLVNVPGEGADIWAGGCDGVVRTWKNVTSKQGAVDPDMTFIGGDDAVSSVLLHPTAAVFATTSGNRIPPQDLLSLDESDSDSDSDTSSDNAGNVDEIRGKDETETETEREVVTERKQSFPSTLAKEIKAKGTKPFDNMLKVWSMPPFPPSIRSQAP